MTAVNIALLGVAGFLAFWAGAVSLVGFVGWRPLARRYPAARWPGGEGHHLRWQSARIGLANYNGVLNTALTAEGLYLRPVRLFAYNHPPLFVPWAAVRSAEPTWLGGLRLALEGGSALVLRGRVAKGVSAGLDAWATAAEAARAPFADSAESSGDRVSARSGRRQRT